MTTAEREKYIWDRLAAAGMTPAGAAGLMGNLYAESGLDPCNLQNTYEKKLGLTDAAYTAAVDAGSYTNFARDGAGYGLAQWTYWSRKEALLAYVRAAGRSVGDLEAQLGFLLQELVGSFKGVLTTLKTAQDVRTASDAVLLQFERPADQSEAAMERRAGYGQMYYNKFSEGEKKLNLLTCILTENDCYKTKRTIKPQGVMVHSTGANNPTLKRYVQPVTATPDRDKLLAQLGTNANANSWNRSGTNACVHAFVGKLADGSVAAIQTLPWDWRGWHAGTGTSGKSANDTHISFEICEDGLTDPAYFAQVYQAAVELTAMLCQTYGLDPLADGVVICHQEGYRRGVASNHGDVLHWWPKHGKTMDDFRAAVAAELSGKNESEEIENMSKEELKTLIRETVKEVLDEENPVYQDLKDVPEYWRPTAAALLDAGAVNGGTPAEVCATDLNLRRETLKAAIVAVMYHDARESKQ